MRNNQLILKIVINYRNSQGFITELTIDKLPVSYNEFVLKKTKLSMKKNKDGMKALIKICLDIIAGCSTPVI